MSNTPKADYKATLNLPKTAFPMKANLAQREPGILEKWQSIDLYQTLRTKGAEKPKFILHDGPPYANGNIHIGHAINKVLKDIIIKSKTLSGFDAPYVPGWDCHGLPIELNVEKKLGKPGAKVSVDEFRKACRTFADKQIDIQRTSFIRLGVMGDWYNPYLTMNFTYQADIIRSFGKIYEKGHIEKGVRPVHWCVACGSALAEAEVEYKDKQSPSIDVLFEVVDKAKLCAALGDISFAGDVFATIWTTTPWTLPANEAVAVHPEHTYALAELEFEGRHFATLLAVELLPQIESRLNLNLKILGTCLGKDLEGNLLHHPFYDKKVPIVLGSHVTLETGTGLVHTAPAHGLDDFYVSHAYKLPVESPVNAHGIFVKDAPLVGGCKLPEANTIIIQTLKDKQRLLNETKLEHSYPHCWRHKTPLIFRATPQWFVSMSVNHLGEQALAEIEKVSWMPAWGKTRIHGMVADRPDWCISRQRTWGVPIVMVTHKETGQPHPDMLAIIEHVADKVAESGMEIWHHLNLNELPFDDLTNYEKSTDSLDVWFESGVSHACVLKRRDELNFPANLYLEGSDQHRGWFQSSLLTSVAMNEQAPYDTVLTHGFTVDANGRKMSKSLGNVVAPEKIIQTMGADVLRLWIAATDYRNDMHVSEEIFKRTSEAYRRIRNTARFLLSNLDGFDPAQHLVAADQYLALDAWIVNKAKALQASLLKAYDEYQFHLIYQKIHNFCVVELGSIYLDIIKDRQYTTKANSLARRSAQSAMYHIATALSRWLAPILSFTAEEIWSYLPGEKTDSVFLSEWYKDFPNVTMLWDEASWDTILAVRTEVNKALEAARNAELIRSGLAAEVHLYVDDTLKALLAKLEDELRFVLITSSAVLHPLTDKPETAASSEMPNLCIEIKASSQAKCQRCWHHREDVNANPEYPEICGRCVSNIQEGEGEVRRYA